MLWNNLPKCLKNAVSVNNFKQIIKTIADISDSHTAIPDPTRHAIVTLHRSEILIVAFAERTLLSLRYPKVATSCLKIMALVGFLTFIKVIHEVSGAIANCVRKLRAHKKS